MNVKTKSFSKELAAFFIAAMVIVFSAFPAFAAEVAVNGEKLNTGDTLTYSVNIKGLDEKFAALNIYIKYDSKVLKFVEDSVNTPVLVGGYINADEDGVVVFNAASFTGYKNVNSDGTDIISMSFKINDGADVSETKIEHEIIEIYNVVGEEIEDVTGYSVTETVVEGLNEVVKSPMDVNADDEEEQIFEANPELAEEIQSANNRPLIIAVVVFAVIIIAVVLIVLLSRRNKK